MSDAECYDRLGYPDRTFETEILPCDPSSSISFREGRTGSNGSSGGASASTASGREPLRHARPEIGSTTTQESLATAAQHLQRGQAVAFPTETVYGLAASALDQSAASKIYAAKKRPADNPLIVHVSDLDMLERLLPDDYRPGPVYAALMQQFWPGALTFLFPVSMQRPKVPSVITCGQPSVAVRMPSHPIARALIALSGLPLAAPSANASGRPSPTTAAHVMRDLGGELDAEALSKAGFTAQEGQPLGRLKYILDGGPSDVGLESTVVDGISTPGELRVLRPGGITVEQISDVLRQAGLLRIGEGGGEDPQAVRLRVYGKDLARSAEQESNPTTPGMKYRHYSPTARVVMLLPSRLLAAAFEGEGDKGETSNRSAAARQVVDSLEAPTSARQARTFPEIVEAQIAKTGLARSDRGGVDGTRQEPVRIGIMMSNDSDLARWVHRASSRASQPEAPSSDAQPAVHPHLLPPLTFSTLAGVEVQPFDLGPTERGEVYAQRMFDGLRTLDEGPLVRGPRCDLIFVEALHDDGVGLAVMNRLKKASSESVVVDC
ncbi:uncharacterized protein PFL1_02510 [Pseudozyma flocculosa PF-1]|uniref:Threonylcarbamoyl-AMP synthase n=2 Tax=Pseudozyma flocculosa TaxID=84751 RepID=A0A5C3EYG7_9BASI|nr:uncharacterized protein PFL1_02510 [Pseudozyma flocculosa PF-1]EPQ29837.1 hypothetical protein PFL1_02510 [Pseudozyma flocculosa PF-1]SPO37132.1 related to translation initiation protein SUA5 [Pseudozyma flocculosa]